ncbi:flagellar motor protein MotB [Glutamicibacter creatinolyticus]|uniref:OmpA/MotB family protein n=1 Tax=Glutamicibacter creatinolyticus TaxID=162496 RepID=UPI00340E6A1E
MSRRNSSRRGAGHGEEEGNSERWMASYMDMVTVLMCLFIVLYAMSTVDQEKFTALRNSLASGFGVQETQYADTAEGIVVPPELEGTEGLLADSDSEELTGEKLHELAEAEQDELEGLKRQIEQRLEETGHAKAAVYQIDARGLTVRLVSAETFFVPNSAQLTGQARQIIDAIGPVLAPTGRYIEVEGFADVLHPVDPYPTNWELSASRATGVLRALVEDAKVAPARISAVGYGDARPVKNSKDLQVNRRVDIVVLSDQPETVRNLLSSAP